MVNTEDSKLTFQHGGNFLYVLIGRTSWVIHWVAYTGQTMGDKEIWIPDCIHNERILL